jgi:hypothetical protein
MERPRLDVSISEYGIEQVKLFYRPSQRSDAWKLCQEILPLLEVIDGCTTGEEPERISSETA